MYVCRLCNMDVMGWDGMGWGGLGWGGVGCDVLYILTCIIIQTRD